MSSLLEHPLNNPVVVVAETEVVIQGRKAMGLARFFHFVQLRNFELMIFDDSPIELGFRAWPSSATRWHSRAIHHSWDQD
jgi:hypothetical protein